VIEQRCCAVVNADAAAYVNAIVARVGAIAYAIAFARFICCICSK
jgi:hypothetical protein